LEPRWIVWRGVPSLEKEGCKRFVEIGALIGLSVPLCAGMVGGFGGNSRESSFGGFVGEIVSIGTASVMSAVTGAVLAASFVAFFRTLLDLLRRKSGRDTPSPTLPPPAVLAKTEVIGRQPNVGSEVSENLTPEVTQVSARSELRLGIHTKDH